MNKLALSVFLLVPLVASGIYACDQAGPAQPELDPQLDNLVASTVENGNPFIGSWMMTSAVVGDDEFITKKGLQYNVTLRSDLSFSSAIANDVDHLVCPEETSCEWDGTYTYTAATITFDDTNHPDSDERGEDTGMYALCGGTWFYLDDGDTRLTYNRTGLRR